ncbi:MAG: SpoIVB peptidase S55 domain-containing protein [Bryobacteraceae bacterium]
MLRSGVPAVLAFAAGLAAQTAFFPLKDVRAGMHGTGRTVFTGNKVEEFQVEILGVLDGVGPKQSLILARLSGGPLEHAGVMEGMSGSPIYLDGKLAGAVAMAFPFAKDPIAAIRPIEDMVRPSAVAAARPAGRVALADADLTHIFTKPAPAMAGDARMVDIATPLSFGGFSRGTLEAFAPQLRQLGLEPRQMVSGGGETAPAMGNPADLQPGSMISVLLLAGDYSVGAQGTVTLIEGNRIFAFGHRFLDLGPTALPFARAEVVSVVASNSTSFKLATSKEWMGAIRLDGDTAISGDLGKLPAMVPVSIAVSRAGRAIESYRMQMVGDPLLSPLLLQMAVYSAIDSTERSVGASSMRVSGEIEFQNAPAPLRIQNVFSGDTGAAQQVSLSAAIPLAFVMQSGFDALKLKSVSLAVETFEQKKEWTIDSVSASRREVRPGEAVRLRVSLAGDNGAEVARTVDYQVPAGAQAGPLYFTVSDAATANLNDFRSAITANPRNPGQLISTANNLHANNKAYVRVWRGDAAFQLEGADLPAPPASVALVLEGAQSNVAGITQVRNSKIASMEIDAGDMVISGVKTIQVEVKP